MRDFCAFTGTQDKHTTHSHVQKGIVGKVAYTYLLDCVSKVHLVTKEVIRSIASIFT